MYQQQQGYPPRQPRKPGSGRVWPAKKRTSPNSPHFTGDLTLLDGHVVRVSVWESTDRGGVFNGFSIKLSEDTRQGNGYQAQGGYGQPQGYGQQQGGYAPQQVYGGNYGAPPSTSYTAQTQQGPIPPQPPVEAYGPADEGYVPGFDD